MPLFNTLTVKKPFASSSLNCNFTAIIQIHGKEGNITAGRRD